MRNLLVLVAVLTGQTANAGIQFGTGQAPGMQCPYDYAPAPGSYRGDDEIRNLSGQVSRAQSRMQEKERRVRALSVQIDEAKSKIRRVIRSSHAMSEIERHWEYKANPQDYATACGRAERGASAGSSSSNVVLRPSKGRSTAGKADPGLYPVPREFCVGGDNEWQHLVDTDGYMLENVCDYEVPFSRSRPSAERSDECREGLRDYYALQTKREQLESEVRELRDKIARHNDDRERIEEQISEGTYCPYCNGQRRGESNMGTGNFAMMGIALLTSLITRQDRQAQAPPQPMLVRVPRGPGGAPAIRPFPGPAAFPGRPYIAPVPGYYGLQAGNGRGRAYYGAAPGGIGAGSFGCNGSGPYAFDNPLAPDFMPFLDGGGNSLGTSFANSDPFAPGFIGDPNAQHSLLNPGFAPGVMPYIGNGIGKYQPYDPFRNEFGNDPVTRYAQLRPPELAPYLRGSQPINYQLGADAIPVAGSNISPIVLNPEQSYRVTFEAMRQGITTIGRGQYVAPEVLPLVPNSRSGAPPTAGQPQPAPAIGQPPPPPAGNPPATAPLRIR